MVFTEHWNISFWSAVWEPVEYKWELCSWLIPLSILGLNSHFPWRCLHALKDLVKYSQPVLDLLWNMKETKIRSIHRFGPSSLKSKRHHRLMKVHNLVSLQCQCEGQIQSCTSVSRKTLLWWTQDWPQGDRCPQQRTAFARCTGWQEVLGASPGMQTFGVEQERLGFAIGFSSAWTELVPTALDHWLRWGRRGENWPGWWICWCVHSCAGTMWVLTHGHPIKGLYMKLSCWSDRRFCAVSAHFIKIPAEIQLWNPTVCVSW